jgi:hypothetical protein
MHELLIKAFKSNWDRNNLRTRPFKITWMKYKKKAIYFLVSSKHEFFEFTKILKKI